MWRRLNGEPTLQLSGGARSVMDGLAPEGMHAVVDVSLTDEVPLAHAMVIISALPHGVERPS